VFGTIYFTPACNYADHCITVLTRYKVDT